MSDQAPSPMIQVPGAPPPQGVAAPPATSPAPAGTVAPPAAPRPPRAQRKPRGVPALPMAVGAVNVAATLGSEVAMTANPAAGAAAGVAALAAGVYALRTNARYRRGPNSGVGAWLRSSSPVRTNRPGWSGGRTQTNSGGPAGPGVAGPAPRGPRSAPGPAGPSARTSGPVVRTVADQEPPAVRAADLALVRADQGAGPRQTRAGPGLATTDQIGPAPEAPPGPVVANTRLLSAASSSAESRTC